MKIASIVFINRAPFDHLCIDFDDENIAVLSGINGAGKTTILSYIVDSFFELARIAYKNEFEGKSDKFYRVSSGIYSIDKTMPSIVYMRFKNDNGDYIDYIDYIDFRDNNSSDYYDEQILLSNKIPFSTVKSELKNGNVLKYWSISNEKEIATYFSDNLLTYFPAYRYEKPSYLNDPYSFDLSFNKETRIKGFLPNPIEVTSDLPQVANWIMDLVLDGYIYQGTAIPLIEQINDVVNNILSSKTGCQTRLGIGPRNSGLSRIAIMDREVKDHQVYPSVFNMSSGELSLLCLFGELVKQADVIGNIPATVKGIVLIDEIDKHLHIQLQREILPKLFVLFPGVQFIVSSHSPFLGLGLEEETSIIYKLYDLENGGIPCFPQDIDLYKEVYNMMVSENNRYLKKLKDLQTKISSDTKPLIITEGKTDWKHIKTAMKKLDIKDLDIDFYEYEDSLGDEALLQLIKGYARIRQSRRIIGIFDRDNISHLKCPQINTQDYVSLQNNVYAFAIPAVRTNEYGNEISIEHYYKSSDLTKTDASGRRIFLGSEFYPSGISKDTKYHTHIKGIDKKVSTNGIIDEKVYDICTDPEEKLSIALSKNDFAELVLSENDFSMGFDFSQFQKIFDIIRSILSEDYQK